MAPIKTPWEKGRGVVSRDQPRVWNGSPSSLAPGDQSAPDWGRMTGRAAFEVGRQPSNLAPLVRQHRGRPLDSHSRGLLAP